MFQSETTALRLHFAIVFNFLVCTITRDQLNLIKFDDNDNDDNFDNDGHDEVINSEPIKMKFEVEKMIRVVQPA